MWTLEPSRTERHDGHSAPRAHLPDGHTCRAAEGPGLLSSDPRITGPRATPLPAPGPKSLRRTGPLGPTRLVGTTPSRLFPWQSSDCAALVIVRETGKTE